MKSARRHTYGSTLQRVLRGELTIEHARSELLGRAVATERKERWKAQAIQNVQNSATWKRLNRLENVSKLFK